jgi:hypothetical protein
LDDAIAVLVADSGLAPSRVQLRRSPTKIFCREAVVEAYRVVIFTVATEYVARPMAAAVRGAMVAAFSFDLKNVVHQSEDK